MFKSSGSGPTCASPSHTDFSRRRRGPAGGGSAREPPSRKPAPKAPARAPARARGRDPRGVPPLLARLRPARAARRPRRTSRRGPHRRAPRACDVIAGRRASASPPLRGRSSWREWVPSSGNGSPNPPARPPAPCPGAAMVSPRGGRAALGAGGRGRVWTGPRGAERRGGAGGGPGCAAPRGARHRGTTHRASVRLAAGAPGFWGARQWRSFPLLGAGREEES